MAAYRLFWDEFSSWYLEMIKPAYQKPIDSITYKATLSFFDSLLRLLHPFMPFITEELWQNIEERKEDESIMYATIPTGEAFDQKVIDNFEVVKGVISGIRNIRLQRNIAQKESLELFIIGTDPIAPYRQVVLKMGNVSNITEVTEKADATAASFMVGTTEYAVPLNNLINKEEEIAKLEVELKHKEGFLQGVLKKLSNERFVANAPEKVLALERKKQTDAESIIKTLEESIAALKK